MAVRTNWTKTIIASGNFPGHNSSLGVVAAAAVLLYFVFRNDDDDEDEEDSYKQNFNPSSMSASKADKVRFFPF